MVYCETCGEEFTHISNHWNYNESHRTEFSDKQKEIITGLLMGDGTINTNASNPRFSVSMINEEFLEYLDKKFGLLTTGVKKVATKEDLAERNKQAEFSTTVNEENYHDVYRVSSRTHPGLFSFTDWYDSGEKVWPERVKLTPTVLKYLYVSDGNMTTHGKSTQVVRISMSNERDNENKITSYFKDVDLPVPKYYRYEYDDGHVGFDARFNVEESKEVWEYMGEPLPGFEYKWPETFMNEKRLTKIHE